MPVTIQKLRELTNKPNMTDQEARAVLNVLYGLAELIIEDLQSKNNYGFIQEDHKKAESP